MLRLYTTLLVCIASIVGCSGNQAPDELNVALRNASTLKLHSLDPTRLDKETATSFYRHQDLGAVDVSAADIKSRVLDSLDAAIADSSGAASACFEPRHGLRAVYDGKTYDVVICFKCYQAYWYIDEVRQPDFLLTDIAKKTFDEILTAGNVELPSGKTK